MSTPFDLHVLSTPPAFILSQDQTLNKMVSKEPFGPLNHLIEALPSFKEILRLSLQALLSFYNQFILVLRVCHVV